MKLKQITTALCMAGAAFAVQAQEWTGYTYSSVSTTAAVKGMMRISDRVSQATDGKLKIKVHLGKTLQIKSSDITQSVGDGVVDFAADYFFSGSVPIARVLNLPMLIENDAEWAKAYAAMKPTLNEAFAKQGVVVLGGYRYPKQIIFTTFPMSKVGDLKGHKIRVTSPEQGHFVEAFDGAAITLSGSEVPTSLERGVIEGVLTASAGGAKKWHEFLPHNYRFPVNYGNSMIIANAKAFADLNTTEQKALRDIVAEEGEKISAEFIEDEGVQMNKQASKGMKITQTNAAEIKAVTEKLKPYWDSWAKQNGPEYEKALKQVRAALGK
jgi:TRAP-type C4-dicarboxylate transport system substrate-binding protein